MFESIFGNLPAPLRRELEKRLEALVLSVDTDKVADIKAIINLARDLSRSVSKNRAK